MTDRRITKHTPGPWSIENDNGDSPEAMGPCLCVTTDTSHIAFVFDDAPANAHLIAAAPDLLEACEAVLLRLDLEAQEQGEDAVFPCAAMRADLRAAITRARG